MFHFFEKLIDPFQNRSGSSNKREVFGFLTEQSQGMKKYIFLVAFFSGLVAITEIYMFKFVGILVDELKQGNSDKFFQENIDVIVQLVFILLFAFPFVELIHTLLCNQTLNGNLSLSILSNKHKYLLKQSIGFYQNQSAGKISNALMQTSSATRDVLMKVAHTFSFASIYFISMAVLLLSIDAYLLLPIFLWFLFFLLVIFRYVPVLRALSATQAEARSNMVGKMVDTYANISTVKLFSNTKHEERYADRYMDNCLHKTHLQSQHVSKVLLSVTVLNAALIFGTVSLSLFLWFNHLITIGAIAAVVAVVLRLYTMSHWVMWESVGIFNAYGVVANGAETLSEPLPTNLTNNFFTNNSYGRSIEFSKINFSYETGNKIISDFSLRIRRGEKLGMIGRSGSGKSTIAKLLIRFYDVDDGSIFIDETDIKEISHESLLDQISVVSQEVELLDRTVRQNILYGNEAVTENEMIKFSKAAEAHDFIITLTDDAGGRGYDARIGVGGGRLSGGQKQRLSIARALIKNSSIIVFDEATSALDVETENRVMKNIQEYIKEKTVIMVSHRISVLSSMDRIAVIDNGRLVNIGSHVEISKQSSLVPNIANTDLEIEPVLC